MLANSVGFKVKLAKGSKCYHSKGREEGDKTRVSGGENKNEKSTDRNKSTLIWISIGRIAKNNTFCLQNKAHKHETTRTRTGRLVMRAKTLSPLVSVIWLCFVVFFVFFFFQTGMETEVVSLSVLCITQYSLRKAQQTRHKNVKRKTNQCMGNPD